MSTREKLYDSIRERILKMEYIPKRGDAVADYSMYIAEEILQTIDLFIDEQAKEPESSDSSGGGDELKIGDRVKLIDDDPDGNEDLIPNESVGTVVGKSRDDDQPYLIEWDHPIRFGHDGESLVIEGRLSKNQHGWWVPPHILEKIPF